VSLHSFSRDQSTHVSDFAIRKENMLATLAWIRETYGSVEKAVVELNMLTPEGIEQLRTNLVVDAKEGEQIDGMGYAKLLP
jgi:hypothetical protein